MSRTVSCRGVALSAPLLLIAAALAGCAGNRVVSRSDDVVGATQGNRAAAVAAIDDFSFEGRVAVGNGRDGGSAKIEWQQRGAQADIVLRAPVSGQTWRLHGGDASGWTLLGTRAEGARGDDAEALLLRETGWRLPFSALRRWLFGLSFDDTDRVELRANGLPARLRSADGWTVEYVDYDESRTPPLATRVRADRAPHKVRLAIAEWRVE